MQSLRDGLIHDATSLFRFVDSIERFIAEHRAQFTYTDATEAFFLYINEQVTTTKNLLDELMSKAEQSSSDESLRYRRELILQKKRWQIRHTYIKPAADAHSLNIPTPLIKLVGRYACTADIVVLLTPELMYFENRPSEDLRSGRVFLEIPYSQGSGFFGNLIIYHELGHHEWRNLSEQQPRIPAFRRLIETLEEIVTDKISGYTEISAGTRDWIKRAYDAWTQELFCDLLCCSSYWTSIFVRPHRRFIALWLDAGR